MNLVCELIVNSDVEHLQQIYTGFSLLNARGFLKLKQTIPPEFLQNPSAAPVWVDYRCYNATVVLNGKISVCYDAHDWKFIDEQILSEVDFYFKRSFDSEFVANLKESRKVFPLGLNYAVLNSGKDLFAVRRAAFYSGKEKIKRLLKGFGSDNLLNRSAVERMNNLEALPDFALAPKVLFMARTWDENAIEDQNQRAAVAVINETRADAVRALRREFGDRFFGGLARDDYSLKHFPDSVLPDEHAAQKRNYLRILRSRPICVTTAGLNQSNGWKLAEYVAFSKGIVSEPLAFEVPGDFAAERNYLEFTDSDSLVSAIARLFDDRVLRCEMMMNNHRYYTAFVRPDALVLNSLAVVAARREDLFS